MGFLGKMGGCFSASCTKCGWGGVLPLSPFFSIYLLTIGKKCGILTQTDAEEEYLLCTFPKRVVDGGITADGEWGMDFQGRTEQTDWLF